MEEGIHQNEFCEKLCKANKVGLLKCHAASNEKSIHEMFIDDDHWILKVFHSNQEIYPESHNELNVLSMFNTSTWLVNYFGHCGNVYAVEPVLHTAGQVFGRETSLVEALHLPDPVDDIIEFFIRSLHKFGLPLSFADDTIHYIRNHAFSSSSPDKANFTDKVLFSRGLFSMLHGLHHSTNGRVLMCDVHIDNFGIARNGTVKIIDADHIFFLNSISEQLSGTVCASNSDCTVGDFHDCYSYCEPSSQRCSANVALSNVQNVCNILVSLVFKDVPDEELNAFKMAYDIMVDFSAVAAKSIEEESSRIDLVIRLLNAIVL